MKYRIHWLAKLTGATGHGTGAYEKEEVQKYCDAMNDDKENKRLQITHWIEPTEETEP